MVKIGHHRGSSFTREAARHGSPQFDRPRQGDLSVFVPDIETPSFDRGAMRKLLKLRAILVHSSLPLLGDHAYAAVRSHLIRFLSGTTWTVANR